MNTLVPVTFASRACSTKSRRAFRSRSRRASQTSPSFSPARIAGRGRRKAGETLRAEQQDAEGRLPRPRAKQSPVDEVLIEPRGQRILPACSCANHHVRIRRPASRAPSSIAPRSGQRRTRAAAKACRTLSRKPRATARASARRPGMKNAFAMSPIFEGSTRFSTLAERISRFASPKPSGPRWAPAAESATRSAASAAPPSRGWRHPTRMAGGKDREPSLREIDLPIDERQQQQADGERDEFLQSAAFQLSAVRRP